jgi:FlaA1/EpsC-like NDP-sugar epimerase
MMRILTPTLPGYFKPSQLVTDTSKWIARQFLRISNNFFFAVDVIVFVITPWLALSIRFDRFVEIEFYSSGLLATTLLFIVIKLTVLRVSGFYERYWRYAGVDEFIHLVVAMVVAVLLQSIVYKGLYYLTHGNIYSLIRSLPLIDGVLSFLLIGSFRYSTRVVERFSQQRQISQSGDRVLVIGAGSAGLSLVREMQGSPQLGLEPVAFIDDDTEKHGMNILGLPVVGDRYVIPAVVGSLAITRIVIAIPSVSGEELKDIVQLAQLTGVQTSTLPGLHEILGGRVQASTIRDIQIEDLLRRAPIQTDGAEVGKLLQGKRVLVSGAGGSIGSELCRQILKCHPAEIMLLGKGENSIFNIQQELAQTISCLYEAGDPPIALPRVDAFIADIRSQSRLNEVFRRFRPDIIFHAAAHKHVPLMELNSPEAITSNVMGTRNLVNLALRYNVDNFVMISTDKAVNPTNVMGASKRVAEMIVLQAAKSSGKPYVVVRFGNVLGSRGSVVPTFKRQIAAGGPITITHPDVCRYFMTIPEAVQLVLQAAVLGHGGEVCMLDMGQPVKIVDLAADLIRLSGCRVGEDINIVYTGLRPGEKLFEELFIPGEEYEPTYHEKILIVRNASSKIPDNLDSKVDNLCKAANQNNTRLIILILKQLVCGYTSDCSKAMSKNNVPDEILAQSNYDVRMVEKRLKSLQSPASQNHSGIVEKIGLL